MKYEVIGWATYRDCHFPDHSPVTPNVELAVRREIVKYGYCFGGDSHEDYCPVLNDGTLVSLSWRGWGGLMARARGENEAYGYMRYYMNEMIDPAVRKYPDEYPDFARVLPRIALAEKFVMHLGSEPFAAMAGGTKRVEFRVLDEKREAVDIGDYIEFCGESGSIVKQVADLFAATDFKTLFEHLTDKSYGGKFTPKELGCPEGETADGFAKAMSAIYPPEKQKCGVVAFELADPVPLHSVAFHVWLDERMDMMQNYLTVDELIELPMFMDDIAIGEALQGIASFERCAGGFCISAEGADLGKAVETVLREVLGKEDALNAIAKEHMVVFTLDVTSLFPNSAPADPVLGDAVKEFSEKTNTHLCVSVRSLL